MNFLNYNKVFLFSLNYLFKDKILRPFLIYGPIYYFFDVVIKLLGNLAFKDACSGILLRLKKN